MALSQKALQQKRARKAARQRADRRPATVQPGMARQWQLAAGGPIHEVLVSANLFDTGMGALSVARLAPDGRIAVAAFLLDIYCLGVKNAPHAILSGSAYEEFIAGLMASTDGAARSVGPSYGRKLLEQLVAWSRNLGFQPHPDYAGAVRILSDIEVADDVPDFSFGRDGKPFYISGPKESTATSRRIIALLEEKCGRGGFDYLVRADGLDR